LIICIDDTRMHTDPKAENYTTAEHGLYRLVQLWTNQNSMGDAIFNVDELWLDHDLGNCTGFASTTNLVFAWLRTLGMMNDHLNVNVIYVHSANPTITKYVDSLSDAGYIVKRASIFEVVRSGILVEREYA